MRPTAGFETYGAFAHNIIHTNGYSVRAPLNA